MADKQIVLTYEGLKEREQELEYLKTQKRKEISEKIKVALGFGDLSENAEYDEAKNEWFSIRRRDNSGYPLLRSSLYGRVG